MSKKKKFNKKHLFWIIPLVVVIIGSIYWSINKESDNIQGTTKDDYCFKEENNCECVFELLDYQELKTHSFPYYFSSKDYEVESWYTKEVITSAPYSVMIVPIEYKKGYYDDADYYEITNIKQDSTLIIKTDQSECNNPTRKGVNNG